MALAIFHVCALTFPEVRGRGRRSLLFDHGCAVFLWLMLAVVPEDRAWEGRGQALLLYQEVTGSYSGLRSHRNLPGAQDKQGLLL